MYNIILSILRCTQTKKLLQCLRSPGWSLNIVLQWTPLPVVAPDKSFPLVATKKSTFPYHWGMQIITITALRITLQYDLCYLDFPSTQILTKQSLGLNFRSIFIPTSELVLSNSAWSKSSSLQFKKGLAHLANRQWLWDFNLEIPPGLERPVANKGLCRISRTYKCNVILVVTIASCAFFRGVGIQAFTMPRLSKKLVPVVPFRDTHPVAIQVGQTI